MNTAEITNAIRAAILAQGAAACGFAHAEPVDPQTGLQYSRWIASGAHGSMDYLERNSNLRFDPCELLPGAITVISCAFPYFTDSTPRLPIAMYARGRDYHKVLRKRLKTVCRYIEENFGGTTRICVDTAPVLERYWAVKAGVGFIGLNHNLIVPGVGSYVFLAEILWTGTTIPSEPPAQDSCSSCGKCIESCPGGALSGSHSCSFDARKCLSYLTIEHRGDLPAGTSLKGKVYGCDVCQQVCPHNQNAVTTSIQEFYPDERVIALSGAELIQMSYDQYSEIFLHSAIKRCPLSDLKRNLVASGLIGETHS